MDKEKDLRAWRDAQCRDVPVAFYVDGIPICSVLGDLFGDNCVNYDGERCRYFNTL